MHKLDASRTLVYNEAIVVGDESMHDSRPKHSREKHTTDELIVRSHREQSERTLAACRT